MSGPRPPRPNEAELVQQSRLKGAEASPVVKTGRGNYSYIAGKGMREGDRKPQQWCYICNEGDHDYHAEGQAAS